MHPDAEKIAQKVKYEWDMFDWLAKMLLNGHIVSSRPNNFKGQPFL